VPAAAVPALFGYRASKNRHTIMELFGFAAGDEQVRVDAEIRSVRAPGASDPERMSYLFPSSEQARRFADDAVTSFEYMGCVVETVSRPG